MEAPDTKTPAMKDPYDSDERENQKTMLGILRARGVSSTAALMEASTLSRGTVLRVADRLCEKRLAIHVDPKGVKGARPTGKPPHLYDFNASCACIIAVSICGNSLDMAVTDSLARIRHIVREELYDDEDAPSVVGRIAKFVAQIRAFPGCRDREILGMAVATQGVVDTDAGIIRTAARFPSWGTDLPLQKMLTECLGADMPVRVDNILRMSALTECRRGRRQGDSSVVHVYCGWEGLGAGIVMDGRVLRGSENLAGELGHMMINPMETGSCNCGSTGCFEQQVSPWRLLSRAGGKSPRDLAAVFSGFRRGEREAALFMDEIARWMAIGLNNINLILNPDVIMLSGVYTEAGQGFLDRIMEFAQGLAITKMPKTLRIMFSESGEAAPLVGGALCLADIYFGS